MEIKLTKAEDLFKKYHLNPFECTPGADNRNMIKAIKEAQRNAIEYALQEASKNADADVYFHGWLAEESMKSGEPFEEGEDYEVYVINESILGIKDELFKLNNL